MSAVPSQVPHRIPLQLPHDHAVRGTDEVRLHVCINNIKVFDCKEDEGEFHKTKACFNNGESRTTANCLRSAVAP